MSRLVDEGWIAPAHAGPSRRTIIGAVACTFALLGVWSLLVAGNLDRLRGDGPRREVTLQVDDRAGAHIADTSAHSGTLALQPQTELRRTADTPFVVVRGGLSLPGDRPARLHVDLPAGVDADRVAVRVLAPHADVDTVDARTFVLDGSFSGARYLVTIPADEFAGAKRPADAGPLADITDRIDADRADARDDRRLLHRLRDGWWWILPIGTLLVGALPVLLWRRHARRFFAMRVPGAGKDMSAGPPSSLDPVGAAVLLAGAGPIDAEAAFAGHVLDLVERRQLQLRRSSGVEHGAATLLGLAHADEAGPDDVAVDALRTRALDDGITLVLADRRSARIVLPEDAQLDWGLHVRARARFERVIDTPPIQRLGAVTAAVAAFALVAAVGVFTAETDGAKAAAALAAALFLPAAATCIAWTRDAREWQRVTRARRTERAQWIAWRSSLGREGGATSIDPRVLPLVVATGPITGLVRDTAAPSAVALDAVTTKTVAALRTLAGDPEA